jgi:hypothetical protein
MDSAFEGLKPRPPLPSRPDSLIAKEIKIYHPGYEPPRLILALYACPLTPPDGGDDSNSEDEAVRGRDNKITEEEDDEEENGDVASRPETGSTELDPALHYGLPLLLVLQACAVLAQREKMGTLYHMTNQEAIDAKNFVFPGEYLFCLGNKFSDKRYACDPPVPMHG